MKNLLKKYNYVVIAIVIVLFGIFDTVNMYKIPSIFNSLSDAFGYSSQDISWIIAAYSTTATIMAIPAGFLGDKFGPKKILIAGIIITFAGSLLGAFDFAFLNGNLYILLTSRILEGLCYIFASICVPVFINMITDKKHVGLAISIWAVRACVACLIGQTFTPLLTGAIGFALTWLLYSGITLIFVIIMLKITSRYKITPASNQSKTTKTKAKNPASWISIIMFFVSFMLLSVVQNAVVDYSPVLMQQRFGIDEALSGLCTSIPMILSAFSCIVFGYFVDKAKSYKPLYTFGLALMGPGAFVMMNFGSPWFIIGAVIMGIGLGAPAITACAVFELIHPKFHALFIGVGMAVYSLGQVIGVNLAQIVLGPELQNYTLCAFVLLAVGIAGTIISALVKTKR